MKKITLVIILLLTSFMTANASLAPAVPYTSNEEIVGLTCVPYKQVIISIEECRKIISYYEANSIMGFGYVVSTKTVIIVLSMTQRWVITAPNIIGAALVGLKRYSGSNEVLVFYGETLVHQFNINDGELCHRLR